MQDTIKERETFSSRVGFILMSAGCAVGLGNIWRFPYVVGENGGGAFVMIYIAFLLILGLPVIIMEFSVGRASRLSIARAFSKLEPKGTKWHLFGWIGMLGNYVLMMFYTTITGWILTYVVYMIRGDFVNADVAEVETIFNSLTANPGICLLGMLIVCMIGFGVCSLGLRNGVEKVTKIMMSLLLIFMIMLVIRSVTLPNASKGLNFYLKPDFKKIAEVGWLKTIYSAMGQAFFTLSLGIGSMAIFGSYIDNKKSIVGESLHVVALDTFVAVMAGLIIFPACFAFGVDVNYGPGLLFVTLPNIFNEISGGRFWGILFFIFLIFAAFSTVIAVFENIVSFAMDLTGCSRKKSALINAIAIPILSIPCALGFNLLSNFHPMGGDSVILDLEDFIVSNNILPLGSLIYVLFCTSRYGWGWENFIKEANTGEGVKFPTKARFYLTYILPIIILIIFILGYVDLFSK